MNANKTYVAYDATGVFDHDNSNLHTFQMMQRWEKLYPERFHFVNMQEINFSSEHDDLIDSTLKARLLRMMAQADNLLVLCSPVMNVESPVLNWQISRSVNGFHLPVIVAYVGEEELKDASIREHWKCLPNKIRKYIGLDSAFMAHIPLTKDKLERALGAYSVRDRRYPWDSTTIF